MNTPTSGTYRWMIFKDRNSWVGVAIEFNIVVTGDEPRVVEFELQEAVVGYLESAKKIKGFRAGQVNSILNQETDDEYESRWMRATQITATQAERSTPSPFSNIYKVGISSLANV